MRNGDAIMKALGIDEFDVNYEDDIVVIEKPDSKKYGGSYEYQLYFTEEWWQKEYVDERSKNTEGGE